MVAVVCTVYAYVLHCIVGGCQWFLVPVGSAALDVGSVVDDEVHTLDDGMMTVGVDGDDNCDEGFTQTDLLCESTLAGCRANGWY